MVLGSDVGMGSRAVIGIFGLLLVMLGWSRTQDVWASSKDRHIGIVMGVSGMIVFWIWLTMGGKP
jgi:hypothetical protein